MGGYIDIALLGTSKDGAKDESGRLLIVELKQWTEIVQAIDKDHVKISSGCQGDPERKHPISQVGSYIAQLNENHEGIAKDKHVCIDAVAYLHNFKAKHSLFLAKYEHWADYADKTFAEGASEKNRLVHYLKSTFATKKNTALLEILYDDAYIIGKVGLDGLEKALQGKENAAVIAEQKTVVDCVRERLKSQKVKPEQEIIVISGGAGTGKTVVGIHCICDYVQIFNATEGKGAFFCMPCSQMLKSMVDDACGRDAVRYLNWR